MLVVVFFLTLITFGFVAQHHIKPVRVQCCVKKLAILACLYNLLPIIYEAVAITYKSKGTQASYCNIRHPVYNALSTIGLNLATPVSYLMYKICFQKASSLSGFICRLGFKIDVWSCG